MRKLCKLASKGFENAGAPLLTFNNIPYAKRHVRVPGSGDDKTIIACDHFFGSCANTKFNNENNNISNNDDDDVVILSHGGGQTRHAWKDTAGAIATHHEDLMRRARDSDDSPAAGENYNSIRKLSAVSYDHRGHGQSSNADSYSLSLFAEDMCRVAKHFSSRGDGLKHRDSSLKSHDEFFKNDEIDDLHHSGNCFNNNEINTGDPILVGASLGGLAALIAHGEMSLNAKAVILVDIAPRMDPRGAQRVTEFMRDTLGGFSSIDEAKAAVVSYIPSRSRRVPSDEGVLQNLKYDDCKGKYFWHWDPAFLDWATFNSEEPRRAEMIDRLEAAAEQVSVPCLLIRAGMSDLVSTESAKALVDRIPSGLARYVDVTDAHHMVAGCKNTDFVGEVVRFIDEVNGS